MNKINFTNAQIQEAASYGIGEQQLAESILIASQARLLNSVAHLAVLDPRAGYNALSKLDNPVSLHPDLKYLEFCLLSMIGRGLTENEHETAFQKVKGCALRLVGSNG